MLYKKTFLILGLILVLAAGLRLWQANTFDIYTDHALYAFRALTWSDFMGVGDKQTTPLQWFNQVPGWSRLSFSDGPPLGFLAEYLSLNIFGTSPLAARLPFILASLLTIIILFFGVRRLVNERAAWLVAFITAISSYSVWTALAGNLEGILIVFVASSLITAALYRSERKVKWFYLWVLSLALGLLTKYTIIFIIPAGLLVMFWPDNLKARLKINLPLLKHLIFAGLIFVTLLSPVIIYNYKVYQARGHFDAALSSMVGMKPQDFIGIANRNATFTPLTNFFEIGRTLVQNNSLPFLILILISLIYLFYQLYRRELSVLGQSILSHTLFLVLMFLFLSSASRFLSIFIPLVVATLAIALDKWWGCMAGHRIYRFVFILAVGLVILGEFFYALNTNLLTRPLFTETWFYAKDRYYDFGFYQAEKWWRQNLYPVLPAKKQLNTQDDLNIYPENISGKPVIIYDDSIVWSGRIWHFEKYKTFYHLPVIPVSYLIEKGPDGKDFLTKLLKLSGQQGYFIYASNPIIFDSIRGQDKEVRAYLANNAKALSQSSGVIQKITDYKGDIVFEIYKF